MILTIFSVYLYGNSERIVEFNQRAMDSWENDPSIALYYTEKSLDLNSEVDDKDEYVRSYYIKSLTYNKLDDIKKVGIYSTYAYNFIKENGFFYKESDFYTFYAKILLDQGQYSELGEILTNKNVINILNEEALLYFNLLKIQKDLFFDEENIEDYIKQNISVGLKLGLSEVLGELYILYGDFNLDINLKKSRDLYQRALELGHDRISAISLLKLGYVYREWDTPHKSVNYLERAFLIAELLSNYKLTTEILTDLSEGYRQIGDYKNLSLTKERLNYLYKKQYSFLLKEQRQILDNNYFYEKVVIELDQSKRGLRRFQLVAILLGVIVLFLIIILSIQQYKLKVLNLGEH